MQTLWQQDRVAGIRQSLRKQSGATTGSTFSALSEPSRGLSSRDEVDGSCLKHHSRSGRSLAENALNLTVDRRKHVGAESGRDLTVIVEVAEAIALAHWQHSLQFHLCVLFTSLGAVSVRMRCISSVCGLAKRTPAPVRSLRI